MKTITLRVLVLAVTALFSSFSFANWGGAYQYMNGESSYLPISNALYKKADGTVCVANFTGQTNFEAQSNLLEQIKDFDDTILECSSEDIQKINTTIDQYFHNDGNSFKATKVALPAIAPGLVIGGMAVSSLVGCAVGNEATSADGTLIGSLAFSSVGGVFVGLLAAFPLIEVAGATIITLWSPGLGMASGITSTLVCYKLAEDVIN